MALGPDLFANACGFGCTTPVFVAPFGPLRSNAGAGLALDAPADCALADGMPIDEKSSSIRSAIVRYRSTQPHKPSYLLPCLQNVCCHMQFKCMVTCHRAKAGRAPLISARQGHYHDKDLHSTPYPARPPYLHVRVLRQTPLTHHSQHRYRNSSSTALRTRPALRWPQHSETSPTSGWPARPEPSATLRQHSDCYRIQCPLPNAHRSVSERRIALRRRRCSRSRKLL